MFLCVNFICVGSCFSVEYGLYVLISALWSNYDDVPNTGVYGYRIPLNTIATISNVIESSNYEFLVVHEFICSLIPSVLGVGQGVFVRYEIYYSSN